MQNFEEYLTERSENPYSNIFFKYYSVFKNSFSKFSDKYAPLTKMGWRQITKRVCQFINTAVLNGFCVFLRLPSRLSILIFVIIPLISTPSIYPAYQLQFNPSRIGDRHFKMFAIHNNFNFSLANAAGGWFGQCKLLQEPLLLFSIILYWPNQPLAAWVLKDNSTMYRKIGPNSFLWYSLLKPKFPPVPTFIQEV